MNRLIVCLVVACAAATVVVNGQQSVAVTNCVNRVGIFSLVHTQIFPGERRHGHDRRREGARVRQAASDRLVFGEPESDARRQVRQQTGADLLGRQLHHGVRHGLDPMR